MGGDHGYHTSRSEDETLPPRLLDGVRCFLLDLNLIPVNQRVLSHATAHDSWILLLCFCKGRMGFAVMPVDDRKLE